MTESPRKPCTWKAEVLANLNYYDDGKIAVGRITQNFLNDMDCTMDEADGIVPRNNEHRRC